MNLSEKNKQYINLIKDIYDISSSLGIKTYIWGGLTIDIFEGKFLREHGDLDGFVENMVIYLDELIKAFENKGYTVSFSNEFLMLKINKDLVHASFNPLVINGSIAEWKHIGNDGSVFFPVDWLDKDPRVFYGIKVLTSGIRFEYAIKTKVKMLTPEWEPREKDIKSIGYLEEVLKIENITHEDIFKDNTELHTLK